MSSRSNTTKLLLNFLSLIDPRMAHLSLIYTKILALTFNKNHSWAKIGLKYEKSWEINTRFQRQIALKMRICHRCWLFSRINKCQKESFWVHLLPLLLSNSSIKWRRSILIYEVKEVQPETTATQIMTFISIRMQAFQSEAYHQMTRCGIKRLKLSIMNSFWIRWVHKALVGQGSKEI